MKIKESVPQDLPPGFQDDYAQVVQQIDREMEAPRLTQISLARRNYNYWNGNQYLLPEYDGLRRVINYKIDRPTKESRMFRSVYNIVFSDGFKFISVALQRGSNTKAVADDIDDEDQVHAAKDADGMGRYLHRIWNIKRIIFRMSFHQWVTGPAFLYNRFVVDKNRFGTIDVPETSVNREVAIPEGFVCPECATESATETCPNCGAPAEWMPEVGLDVPSQQMKQMAMGCVDLRVFSVFHVAIPFEATSQKECPHLSKSELLNKWQARSLYDDLPDSWMGSDDKDSVAYEADRALQDVRNPGGQYGDIDQDRVRHEERWHRPEVFGAFNATNRTYLKQRYPGGVFIARLGKNFAIMRAESMDDHWSICPTQTGEQLTSAPLCNSIIPIQDDTNQFFNMGKEVILRAIPKTLVDSTIYDSVTVGGKALVNELVRINAKGEDMGKLVKDLPLARFSDQMMPFWSSLREFSREVDNILPAIFGGGEAAPTWRQAAQAKNQALMGLLNPFEAQHVTVAQATENGVKEMAREGYGSVLAPPGKSTGGMDLDAPQTIDIAKLDEKGWHMEPMDTTPMTMAERAQRLEEVIKENPAMADLMGLGHPVNIATVQNYLGFDELYVPGSQEREKIERRIKRLLAEQPIMGPDPMTGMASEHSSIPPDEFTDKNHQFIADYIRAWCNSERAEKIDQDWMASGGQPMPSGPSFPGLRNVWLHGFEQDQAAAAQMMAMAPPPEKGGSNGATGGGTEPPPQDVMQNQSQPQPIPQ